jgi:DNA-directed RNA polymerase subunit RPC12/RpoP
MTAAYRAVVAERKDIAVVTVICEDCGAGVSVDIRTAGVPYACPSCGKGYNENTTTALTALGRFHRAAATAEEQAGKPIFRFDIKQTE